MYRWISHNDMSNHELKGHSQTVADMNVQMHQTAEASFPSSLITTSGFDSICVFSRSSGKKLAINDDYALSTRKTSHSEET